MGGEEEPGASPKPRFQASGILRTAACGLGGDPAGGEAPPPATELLQRHAFLTEGVGWGCSPPSPWEQLTPLLSTVRVSGPWADLAEHLCVPLEKAAILHLFYK